MFWELLQKFRPQRTFLGAPGYWAPVRQHFPMPCNWQQLSSLLKPTVERKRWNMNETKRRRTIQNICLVTTQSFTEGSLDARTWKCSLPHQLFVDINFIKTYLSHQCGEKLVAKREFNNTMDKHTMKVVKGDETVGHLPRKFSRIVWYFFARSGEISVEVINRRWCKRLEDSRQLEFNFSNKVQMKLLKELLASNSRVYNRHEDSNKRLI